MKAVVISRYGPPEVLQIQDVPKPQPGRGEILVRVMASALNRADLLQREGKYPAPAGSAAMIPGIEFAGEVAEPGPDATRWRPGQRVFGIIGGGAHAEFLVTNENLVTEIPANLSWTGAAVVPEAFITAHDALWTQAGLASGEAVLIHAVGSGVGLAAVQLVARRGARACGTSRTLDKLQRAMEFGLHHGLAVKDDFAGMVAAVKQWTENRGVDVVLDLVGGAYVAPSIQCMALKGRMMLVGTVAGGKAEIPLNEVLAKRLRLMGTVLRSRSLEEKIQVTKAFAEDVVPLFTDGRLRAIVDVQFPLEKIQDAHRHMASNDSFGKIVVNIAAAT